MLHNCPDCGARTMLGAGGIWHCTRCDSHHEPEDTDMTKDLETVKVDEEWRIYDFEGRIYRIEKPRSVTFRRGGSTHRVVDGEGVVHLVPAPGFRQCVVRFKGGIVA